MAPGCWHPPQPASARAQTAPMIVKFFLIALLGTAAISVEIPVEVVAVLFGVVGSPLFSVARGSARSHRDVGGEPEPMRRAPGSRPSTTRIRRDNFTTSVSLI